MSLDPAVILQALDIVLQPWNLMLIIFGVLLGIVFGVIPGLTAALAVALLVPFTFAMEPLGMAFWPRALLVMLGIFAVHLIVRGRLDEGLSEGPNWRAFCALATGVAYILALPVFGFVLLTPPFIFIAVLLLANSLDRRHLLQAALTAAFGTAGVYLVFHGGLEVQLPEGLLN